jgi:hypothetical protein
MRITCAGYVGIGTCNPNYALTIKSTNAGANRIQLLPATDFGLYQIDNSGGTVYIGTDSSTGAVFGQGNYSMNIYSSYSSNINFYSSGLLRQQINTAGAVTKPYQPLAMGGMAENQSVAATTFTSIAFNTSYGFNQANVGSSWNNSTSTFTAPATGTYLINAALFTSNVGQIAAFINGTRTISMVSSTGTFPTTWHGTLMVKLTSGDALTLRGYGDVSGIITQNTYHTWFGIYFLG